MKFAEPTWLVVGAVVIVALIILRAWLEGRRETELRRFAAERLIPRLTRGVSIVRRRIKAVLFLFAVACLFLALARPQWGVRREEVRMQGIDILIALDTSKSMLATDVAPNRLERAKLAIHDFVSTLGAARIGLIPFAGDAFLLCPLTLDRDAFETSLNELDTEIIPEGGTDIARAIREAEKVLEKGANQKILVLITDGEDLEGGAIKAAKEAAKKGITIHTVGVGTQSGNLIVLDNGRPLTGPDGKAVRSRLDEKTLRKIASITGGMYAPLVGNIAGLEKIRRDRLAKVTKSELEAKTKEIPIERYQWPLGLGLLLLALEFCIGTASRNGRKRPPVPASDTRRRRRPVVPKPKSAASVAATALFAIALVPRIMAAGENNAAPQDPRAIYNKGTELWRKKKFSEAEQKFHDALSSGDLALQNRAYYNMGNTRYRLGQAALARKKDIKKTKKLWEESIKAYDAALKLNPNDEDAKFNKEFVQRKLEELKRQEQQKKQQQQQDKKDQQKNQDQKNKKRQNKQDQKNQKDQNKNKQKNQKNQQNQKNDQQKNQQNQQKQQQDQQKKQDQKNSKNQKNKSGQKQENPSDQKNDKKNQSGDKGEENKQQKDKKQSGDKKDDQKQEKGQEQKDQKKDEKSGKPEEMDKQKGKEEQQQAEAGKQGEEKQQQAQPKSGKPQGQVDQYARPSEEQRVPGQMTKEEAKRLLESLTNEEGKLRIAVPRRTGGRSRNRQPKRDW